MINRNTFFNWLLSLKKQLDAERIPTNSFLTIDRGDDEANLLVIAKNYKDAQFVHVIINQTYIDKEPELVAAIIAIRSKQYEPEKYPDIQALISVSDYDFNAYNAGYKGYQADDGDGDKQFRIDYSTLVNLFAEKMMDKVELIFGAGTSQNNKQVRDRRHNTLYVPKNVPKLQDELLQAQKNPTEINVYLDTSGSIGFEEAMLADAVVGLFKQRYPLCTLNMFSFSTTVRDIANFSWQNVKSIICGGTLLDPVLEHMKDNPCKINVVIGDMYFDETDSELDEPVPENVVWISTVNHPEVQRMWDNMKAKEEVCFLPPTE